jgi:hypothetical protein
VLGYIPISTILEDSPIDDRAYVIEELAEERIIGIKMMEFYDIKFRSFDEQNSGRKELQLF